MKPAAIRSLTRILFWLPYSVLGAHSAPAKERRGAGGVPSAAPALGCPSGPRQRPSRGPGQSPGLVRWADVYG